MAKDVSHSRKEIMKDIILKLHEGLPVEAAKERFEREVGNITSTEIADIEQSLINEGLSPDEIKKFCNVHALLFQSALQQAKADETFPSHPVYLFKLENRAIEKLLGSIKDAVAEDGKSLPSIKDKLAGLLQTLKGIETHYERKEQLLFPFLEKYGFYGPSKVMWGKDNEVRDLLNHALAGVEGTSSATEFEAYKKTTLNPLIEETEGMIFKEENILFPTSMEKLAASDWVEILRDSDQIGYAFIEKPAETEALMRELRSALEEEPQFRDGSISLPTGTLSLVELTQLLNTLSVDITFVDKDDRVKYFSEGGDRIFHRTKSIIGRQVQNCHPPESVHIVQKILDSFRAGQRDSVDFWLNFRGRFVYIKYLALRDRNGGYLGTIEVSQDISRIHRLEGEKRLLDEGA